MSSKRRRWPLSVAFAVPSDHAYRPVVGYRAAKLVLAFGMVCLDCLPVVVCAGVRDDGLTWLA